MGLIVLVLLGLLGVLGAVCSKLLADEFKAWAPCIVARIIATAVQKLPVEKRERFSEEWQSHLNDVPGDLTKIVVACGFLVAAWDIGEGQLGLRKRLLDIAIAALVLFVQAPLLLLIGFTVAVSSSGPILVRDISIGRNGRPFRTFKFRTMCEDAEDRLRAYLASNDEVEREWATTHKLRFDPRVTAIGAVLRRTSLDHLPQLFNVLAGDMSVVGPRPLTDGDVLAESTDAQPTCKPGITGPWMFGRRFKEASYTSNWSLMLDVKIILATIPALVTEDNCGDEKDFEAKWKVGLLMSVVIGLLIFGMLLR